MIRVEKKGNAKKHVRVSGCQPCKGQEKILRLNLDKWARPIW